MAFVIATGVLGGYIMPLSDEAKQKILTDMNVLKIKIYDVMDEQDNLRDLFAKKDQERQVLLADMNNLKEKLKGE